MSSWASPTPTVLWWSSRRSRVLLFAVHVPFLLVAPLVTVTGLADKPQSAWIVSILGLAIGALQLRHSFAIARGGRPAYWPLTLTLLGLLVFGPLPWFGIDWGAAAVFFIATAAMLLTGSLRLAAIVLPLVGISLWDALSGVLTFHLPVPEDVWFFFFWFVALSGGALCIFGASQLVRAVDELFATRAELAELTVGGERLRLSRDLHDLLGQSLSAVSLKGDLALALLRSDARSAAEDEVCSLTDVAREALQNIRCVVHDEHPVSFLAETRGAAALLAAASVETNLDIDAEHLSRAVDELFGWATREGVTNLLRHSQAASCSIRAGRKGEVLELEIINDGAPPSSDHGTGISGIGERAQALRGSVSAGLLGDGRFRLLVTIPEVVA